MLILAFLAFQLVLLDRRAVPLHPEVVPRALHFPANPNLALARPDLEPVVSDWLRHLRHHEVVGAVHNGQLIDEVLGDRLAVGGQIDPGVTVGIGYGLSVVDVLRQGAFGALVQQVLVLGVERMVDSERLRA